MDVVALLGFRQAVVAIAGANRRDWPAPHDPGLGGAPTPQPGPTRWNTAPRGQLELFAPGAKGESLELPFPRDGIS